MGWFSKSNDTQIEAVQMVYDADTIEVLGEPQTQNLKNVLEHQTCIPWQVLC